METCMLLCFHVHITWKHACFSVNVYMKAHYHACSLVLLQLVLTFDHWKRVHCPYPQVVIMHAVSQFHFVNFSCHVYWHHVWSVLTK